ncbi:MAG: IS66 family transposase [Rikenellaceae bacterium]
MERKHQEYSDRLLYEESLHRKHAAARENRVAMERGDDDSETDLTPTKEQMYLDIIKELKESNEEAKNQESASQQSLDKLLEMLAAKDGSIERLTEELRLSREKSAEQIKILQEKSAEQIKILEAKAAAESQSLRNELSSFRVAMERLIASKDADLRQLNGQLFGKRSLKGRRSKSSKEQDDDQDRDNFDGTPESISNRSTDTSIDKNTEQDLSQKQELTGKVVKRPIRPKKYNTMKAAKVVDHMCDISELPDGYKFMKYRVVREFTHVSYVQEDRYQIAVISNKAGNIKEFYTPRDKSDTAMPRENIVKGTHVSPEMLAFMVVNKYLMHTPINRQMLIFQNDKGQFSQQTIANYYTKAYEQMSVLKSYLEGILKKAGSFIHCDETWVRVRVSDGSDITDGDATQGVGATKLVKRYMWTIVNEAEKITYFLYSAGSRSGEVIKSFLREFKGALQSDGYVAYKYFDREDVPTEHLVCMAHVRAKFKYAQPTDSIANYFVDQIGKLYLIEMYNKIEGLNHNEIYRRRKTEAMPILNEMKRKAEEFLKTDGEVASEKMYTAVKYMLNFWSELINYTNEGHYTIDNSAAERSIRPLTVGRKNYIHFGSDKSAEIAAFFYTIMATCKMRGANARDYIVGFFKALGAGRTDYAQMLPGLL